MNEFKILTGNAKEVEDKLNSLRKNGLNFCIMGMSATNETTTVIVETFN